MGVQKGGTTALSHFLRNHPEVGMPHKKELHFFDNEKFFSKYYKNKTYPIDIHCPAQLFVTLSKLEEFKVHQDLATKVFNWSIRNMQSKTGYFYYQLKKRWSSKISYMRWSNAFMFNAMTFYFKEHKTS